MGPGLGGPRLPEARPTGPRIRCDGGCERGLARHARGDRRGQHGSVMLVRKMRNARMRFY